MIEKRGDFNLPQLKRDLRTFRRNIPRIVAEESKNHFVAAFRKGGGQTDRSRSGWKARKPARTPREARRSAGRAILVRSGNMRDDIKARTVSFRQIKINVIHIPYAIYHNDGTKDLPQREFIGDSRVLERKTERLIDQELERILP